MFDAATRRGDRDDSGSDLPLDAYSGATEPRRVALALGAGPQAVQIGEVEPGGPADLAGLRVGDVVLALDGAAVAGADDLIRLLGAERIGRTVEITALRDGRVERVAVTPRERRT